MDSLFLHQGGRERPRSADKSREGAAPAELASEGHHVSPARTASSCPQRGRQGTQTGPHSLCRPSPLPPPPATAAAAEACQPKRLFSPDETPAGCLTRTLPRASERVSAQPGGSRRDTFPACTGRGRSCETETSCDGGRLFLKNSQMGARHRREGLPEGTEEAGTCSGWHPKAREVLPAEGQPSSHHLRPGHLRMLGVEAPLAALQRPPSPPLETVKSSRAAPPPLPSSRVPLNRPTVSHPGTKDRNGAPKNAHGG